MANATKLTLAQLKTAATSYVAADKIANSTITATKETISKLLNKVGKEILIPQEVNDKLTVLDADPMTGPDIIEETFIDFITASTYDKDDSAENVTPQYPVFEDAAYSFPLGRQKFKSTVPFGHIEKACKSPDFFGEITGTIVNRINQSEALYKYSEKKELLAKLISKAGTSLVETMALPTTTAAGEAFMQSVKAAVEESTFANNKNLAGVLAGATPASELVLFLKKGIMPAIDVQTMAGAFNQDRLLANVKIVVVDDFGSNTDSFAILADVRGIKFHNTYNAARTQELADSDAINYVKHVNYTGFLSKYTYVHVFKQTA